MLRPLFQPFLFAADLHHDFRLGLRMLDGVVQQIGHCAPE